MLGSRQRMSHRYAKLDNLGKINPLPLFGRDYFLNFPFQITQSIVMAKDKSPTKEKKKEPAKTPKEKRVAKLEKKESKRE